MRCVPIFRRDRWIRVAVVKAYNPKEPRQTYWLVVSCINPYVQTCAGLFALSAGPYNSFLVYNSLRQMDTRRAGIRIRAKGNGGNPP